MTADAEHDANVAHELGLRSRDVEDLLARRLERLAQVRRIGVEAPEDDPQSEDVVVRIRSTQLELNRAEAVDLRDRLDHYLRQNDPHGDWRPSSASYDAGRDGGWDSD